MQLVRFAILVSCTFSMACADAMVRPPFTSSKQPADAVVVLPGLGYDDHGEKVLRSLAPSLTAERMDLYVPTFVSRSGLSESRERLQRFIRDNRLNRYERVHVFAFIAGGWAFNPLADGNTIPNLATIVYDRSPYQERAPRVAQERLRLLSWVRYGSVVSDLATTPYKPLNTADAKVGLVVETVPTPFIRRYATSANRYGPFRVECDAFNQPYDDCLYVALNHQDLYIHFGDVWPKVLSFIRTGRFTSPANRTPPAANVAAVSRQRG
jgi:hypothetical protein